MDKLDKLVKDKEILSNGIFDLLSEFFNNHHHEIEDVKIDVSTSPVPLRGICMFNLDVKIMV